VARLLLGLLLFAGSAAAQGLEEILAEAAADRWQGRWDAIVKLSHLPQDDQVFQLRVRLLKDERPRVREAIAWACWHQPDLANASLLAIALRDDPEPAVRRAAARALVRYRDRRSVEALVQALGKEVDVRTRLQIADTLRSLTPAPCLLDAAEWALWWERNREDPRFQPADEAPHRGTYEGVVLETRTVAAVRSPKDEAQAKEPLHILALPTFGMSSAEYGPCLLPLRARAAITWVRLPSVQELTGSSGYGNDVPEYPVDRLVAALDLFRTSLGIGRFVILAQGATGWIAMRYAVLHEKRVAALVLVDTALDREAYGAALERGAAKGDERERFTANTLLRRNGIALDTVTLDRLQVYGLEAAFRSPADMEIAFLYHSARDPQGFATVPDLSWKGRQQIDVPALFVYSGATPFSGHVDGMRIRKHFPQSMVAPLSDSRAKPYIEDNERFHEVLSTFLAKFLP
jgi:pimeloyl-ACP methyl ester carboxylesterase